MSSVQHCEKLEWTICSVAGENSWKVLVADML